MPKKFSTKRQSDFYCTLCGNKGIPVFRPENKMRPSGHLKNLYCIHCHRETPHAEVRPLGKYTYRDFKCEFKYGNFDETGHRKVQAWTTFVNIKKKEGLY